jgi:NAD(P)-dependent dehydrogenase (short-subunit alcohol dehydrogenase family)
MTAKLVDTSEKVWDQIQNVNLKALFLGCKFAIPAMLRAGGGAIVNIASVLGFVGDPDLGAYCAEKGGVIALTKVAALIYGPQGIGMNCICPGDVETPLVQAYFDKTQTLPDFGGRFIRNMPCGALQLPMNSRMQSFSWLRIPPRL